MTGTSARRKRRHPLLLVILVVAAFYGVADAVAGDDTSSDSSSQGAAPAQEPATGKARAAKSRKRASAPRSKPRPAARTFLVTRVIDGDTIELGDGERVRLVGIDTPETGECGYLKARDRLAALVEGRTVTLGMSDEDRDSYGRLLRYVDVGSTDAGLRLLEAGLAIARYDSRDGYGFHPREPRYIKADRSTANLECRPRPQPQPFAQAQQPGCSTGYDPCLPPAPDLDCANVTGPVRVTGSDPHRLDADGDGWGCDA